MAQTKERFDHNVLGKYRKKLFPVIGKGIITGYNIYKEEPKSELPYEIDYFHSDLGIKKGKEQNRRPEVLRY